MDEKTTMAIIEALGEKICSRQDAVKNLQEYMIACDKQIGMLRKRIHELESRDGEKVREECETPSGDV